jgi:hypothetical protein
MIVQQVSWSIISLEQWSLPARSGAEPSLEASAAVLISFVIDIRGSPFGNLVSREIMSKLHRWLPLAIASTVALVPSVQGKLYDSSKGDMAPRLFVGVCAKSKRMRSRY